MISDRKKAEFGRFLRNFIENFQPRPEVTRFIDELRRDPATQGLFSKEGTRPTAALDEILSRAASRKRNHRSAPATEPEDSTTLTLVVDYANGMTQEEIAHKHGLHVQTVRKRLQATGVEARTGRVLDSQDIENACHLLSTGMSAREVARMLRVAHTTLLRALRRFEDSNHL